MHDPAGAGTRARAADRWRLRTDGQRADVDLRRHEHHQRRARRAADPGRLRHLEDLVRHRGRPDPLLGRDDAGDVRRRLAALQGRGLADQRRLTGHVGAADVRHRDHHRGRPQRHRGQQVPVRDAVLLLAVLPRPRHLAAQGAGVRLHRRGARPRPARRRARQDLDRTGHPGHRPELLRCLPGRHPGRRRRRPGLRDRDGDHRSRRVGAVGAVPVLPGVPLRLDLAAARHHRARRHGQPGRRSGRGDHPRARRDADGDLRVAAVVHPHLLRRDHDRPAVPPAGPVRFPPPSGRDGMTLVDRLAALSTGRARRLAPLIFFLVLIGYPIVFPYAIYEQGVLLLAFLLALMAVSWNIISGYAGYVSLGHSVFLGLGAYTGGLLAENFQVNPLWFMPVGGLVAFVAATLVGLVVLRTRGHAFVIITIALLLAMQVLVTNFSSLTNGSNGVNVPLPFWSSDYQNMPFYYLFLALLAVTIAFAAWVRRTKFGTGLLAIREDEDKAAAIGVNTTRYKVLAYAASAVPIGIAGVVYAYFLSFLNPIGAFSLLTSVTIVVSALLGGRGTIWGPVLGAFVVSIVSEAANVYGGGSDARLLVLGLALVAVVLFLPVGVLPAITARLTRRREAERAVEYTNQAAVAVTRPPLVVA